MSSPDFDSVSRKLFLPVTWIVSAIALGSLTFLLHNLQAGEVSRSPEMIIPSLIWLISSLILWTMYIRRDVKGFFYGSFVVCVLLLVNPLMDLLQRAESGGHPAYHAVRILTSLSVILFCFLWFRYRPFLLGQAEKAEDALPFLGVVFILGGLEEMVLPALYAGHFDLMFSGRSVFQILSGIGFLARDRSLSLLSVSVWTGFSIYTAMKVLYAVPGRAIMAAGWIIFPAAMIVLIFLLPKSCFPRDILGSAFSSPTWISGRKTCSACKKEVPLSARAGQQCPHCGAYWSTERTIQQ